MNNEILFILVDIHYSIIQLNAMKTLSGFYIVFIQETAFIYAFLSMLWNLFQNNSNYIQSFVLKSSSWSPLCIHLLWYIDSVCLLKCDWVYSVGYQNACNSVFTVHLFLCYHCFVTDRSMNTYKKVNQNSTKYSAQSTLELENAWCLNYYFLIGFGDIIKFKFKFTHIHTGRVILFLLYIHSSWIMEIKNKTKNKWAASYDKTPKLDIRKREEFEFSAFNRNHHKVQHSISKQMYYKKNIKETICRFYYWYYYFWYSWIRIKDKKV